MGGPSCLALLHRPSYRLVRVCSWTIPVAVVDTYHRRRVHVQGARLSVCGKVSGRVALGADGLWQRYRSAKMRMDPAKQSSRRQFQGTQQSKAILRHPAVEGNSKAPSSRRQFGCERSSGIVRPSGKVTNGVLGGHRVQAAGTATCRPQEPRLHQTGKKEISW